MYLNESMSFGGKFGTLALINQPATELPANVVKAFKNISTKDCTYTPIWYIGKQTGNGVNHTVVCKRIKDNITQIVLTVMNMPPANTTGKKASLHTVVDTADLYDLLQEVFDKVLYDLVGVKYHPIAYIGEIADENKGVNYHILCQAVRKGCEPYAVTVEINILRDTIYLVSIQHIEVC